MDPVKPTDEDLFSLAAELGFTNWANEMIRNDSPAPTPARAVVPESTEKNFSQLT